MKPGGRYTTERADLVNTLREQGIRDEAVLSAIGKVERHQFLTGPLVARAYENVALPIASGQTISQPYTVAYMTQMLGLKRNLKVLEIGTGSGYQAAVLAALGARVFTIERHSNLLLEARQRLEVLGYSIASKIGDGTIGWNEFAPYDGIIVTAGAPDVPKALVDQLALGGKLVIPIGNEEKQRLYVIEKTPEGFSTKELEVFKFVPLVGKEGWKK